MDEKRVVITGLGVIAPNGKGIAEFTEAIRSGKSGICYLQELEDNQFGCRVGGLPKIENQTLEEYFTPLQLRSLRSNNIIYGYIAGVDAWRDAGLRPKEADDDPDWDSGCIMGTGLPGVETWKKCIYEIDAGKVRRLGSGNIEQGMASGVSAFLGGALGLGNQVSTNSSACSTGTEAILMAFERIKSGRAKRMLAGSSEGGGIYVWGAFDAMRILNRKYNDQAQLASRPMSASASGFVPGAGAGVLVLEDLESAQKRGARIYAEILGGSVNSGGQRGSGSMTAPNPSGMYRCIQTAVKNSKVMPEKIDAISGHLTATMGDPVEVETWSKALGLSGSAFPWINSLKSMTGHCLSAAGALECAAAVLQLTIGFIHPSINCEDLHPEIASSIDPEKVPQTEIRMDNLSILAKASFGFGDVNACVIFKKWEE